MRKRTPKQNEQPMKRPEIDRDCGPFRELKKFDLIVEQGVKREGCWSEKGEEKGYGQEVQQKILERVWTSKLF